MLGMVVGGTVALLTGCGLVKNYRPFRYRLTVEVDTPQGLRTGSSVIEVTAGEVGTTLGGASAEARGEAVAVDIASDQTLFVLLRSEASSAWAAGIMSGVTPKPNDLSIPREDRFAAHIDAVRANHKLNTVPRWFPPRISVDKPVTGYPFMVQFGDLRDPKTVKQVDPDNLAGSFGPGVTLRRITVQLTDDPVTTGIERRLPWLPNQNLPLVPHPRDVLMKDWPFGASILGHDFSNGIFR
tara:strand:- start:1035 stop:1754 length:720 start_codon:yes stop_codon:yes gene_type:complete